MTTHVIVSQVNHRSRNKRINQDTGFCVVYSRSHQLTVRAFTRTMF